MNIVIIQRYDISKYYGIIWYNDGATVLTNNFQNVLLNIYMFSTNKCSFELSILERILKNITFSTKRLSSTTVSSINNNK